MKSKTNLGAVPAEEYSKSTNKKAHPLPDHRHHHQAGAAAVALIWMRIRTKKKKIQLQNKIKKVETAIAAGSKTK